MEESGPAPLARRLVDQRVAHRFFRFDPTVSSGTLLQLGSIAVGFAMAYGTYQTDRTQTRADIDSIKAVAERDRSDVKTAAGQLTADVKEMKADIKDVSIKLVEIKAQTMMVGQQRGSK